MIIKSPSIWNINGIRMVPGRWSNLANQHQSFLWSVGRFLRIEIVQNSDHLGSVKNGDNAEIVVFICNYIYGNGSKPCSPGEHQNRWQMDFHPLINCIYRYWSIAIYIIIYIYPFNPYWQVDPGFINPQIMIWAPQNGENSCPLPSSVIQGYLRWGSIPFHAAIGKHKSLLNPRFSPHVHPNCICFK